MFLGHHRVLERVVLVVVVFDDRARQLVVHAECRSCFEIPPAATLRTTTSSRDDLDLADKPLAHVEAADEMRGNADPPTHHQAFAMRLFNSALAGDDVSSGH